MRMGIIGKKVGMTQIYDEAGMAIPVTVIDTSNCSVTQVKNRDKDGYCAVQLGYSPRKPQNVNKATQGRLKKASVSPRAQFQEFRFDPETDMTPFKLGDDLSVTMFEKGDRVDVSGTTIGKGFGGVMKKYGFHGKPATHGTAKHFRHGGSIGTTTFPGRVMKNKKMPSQMGNQTRTISNLKVIDVRPEANLLLLEGGVPGSKNSYVVVRSAIKRPLPEGRSWTGKAAEPAKEEAPKDK